MDSNADLIQLLQHIQKIKTDLYRLHRPELIDYNQMVEVTNKSSQTHPKAYEQLVKQQASLIHKRNKEAQEKVLKDKLDFETTNFIEYERENIHPSPIITISSNKIIKNESDELHRPWNKLSQNAKIQVTLKFVEALMVMYTKEQLSQLRYLLLSIIAKKKLKASEIDYDCQAGRLLRIHRLFWDSGNFKLYESDDHPEGILVELRQDDEVSPVKKLTLKKIENNIPNVERKKLILKK